MQKCGCPRQGFGTSALRSPLHASLFGRTLSSGKSLSRRDCASISAVVGPSTSRTWRTVDSEPSSSCAEQRCKYVRMHSRLSEPTLRSLLLCLGTLEACLPKPLSGQRMFIFRYVVRPHRLQTLMAMIRRQKLNLARKYVRTSLEPRDRRVSHMFHECLNHEITLHGLWIS